MPNDVVLDPTVHHLLAEDRFNKGKIRQIMNRGNSSKSRPLHHDAVSEAHDLSPPRCSRFLEAGTQDFLWLYKSRRKASVRMGGCGGSKRRNKQGNDEWKTNNTEEKIKKQRAGEKNRDYSEKERGRGESQISPAIVFVPAEKEQQRTKDYWQPASPLSTFLHLKTRGDGTQSKKEAEGKNTSRGKSPRPLLLPSAFPEPREKAKEDRKKERGVA